MNTGGSRCSSHRIYESVLKSLLLNDIKRHMTLIRDDECKTLSILREKLTTTYNSTVAVSAKELRKLKQELHEIEIKAETLYENRVSGIISAERFTKLASVSEARRTEIQAQLDAAEQSAEAAKAKFHDIDRWIRLIKENSHIEDVDRDLIDALVDKIVVGEKIKEDGVTTQDVKIFYKYVGLV